MQRLRDEETTLCSQLEIPALGIASEVPQESDFREMREHLSRMRSALQTGQNTFDKFRQRLFPLLESLERCTDGELETEIVWTVDDCRLPLTTGNLEAMERRLAQLQAEEEGNKEEADKLRTRLGRLWARLEVPENRRATVLASCTGHKPSTLRTIREEVNQQEELKRQNVEKLICALRTEIAETWEKCFYSQQQRDAFPAYHRETSLGNSFHKRAFFSKMTLKNHSYRADNKSYTYRPCQSSNSTKHPNKTSVITAHKLPP